MPSFNLKETLKHISKSGGNQWREVSQRDTRRKVTFRGSTKFIS